MTYRVEGETLVLDLHGHPGWYAVDELAPLFVDAAWKRGFKRVQLIHGSPDVLAPYQADLLGRGHMKWRLRGALSDGEFMEWAWYRRSVKHSGLQADSGAMTLALRPNPNPEPDYEWPEYNEPMYDYKGPGHRRRRW